MARRTHRVSLPRKKPDSLIKLAGLIYAKHISDEDESPLKIYDMESFIKKIKDAEKNRLRAKQLRRESEKLMQEARIQLGTELGQTKLSEGTALNMMSKFRDLLLVLNSGHEEALGRWGFDVVTGSTQPFSKKKREKKELRKDTTE
jgi:hypothetical protein